MLPARATFLKLCESFFQLCAPSGAKGHAHFRRLTAGLKLCPSICVPLMSFSQPGKPIFLRSIKVWSEYGLKPVAFNCSNAIALTRIQTVLYIPLLNAVVCGICTGLLQKNDAISVTRGASRWADRTITSCVPRHAPQLHSVCWSARCAGGFQR